MNDQGNKKILFNKSTLWSLKAELVRKQEEVNEKKRLPQHKIENFKPQPSRPSNTDDGNNIKTDKKSFKDILTAVDTEELEAARKAKAILEKKAEIYDHLSDTAGSSQLTSHFLVDFNAKKQQKTQDKILDPSPKSDNSEIDFHNDEDDNDWTEFTDCLGRTRRCLKSDLELYMKRDRELMRIMTNNRSDDNIKEPVIEEENPKPEKPFLVQKTNDYLQSLREKWEQKEKELLAKDKDIHYQDLLFDEARMHGVSYYSFSTDETERRKQMEELMKQREETLRAQQEAEALRRKRDELLAARVAAARARQRARAGLPPEEPQDNQKDFTTCLLEFLTQQKDEADAKAKEKERKEREEREKERQKLREAYVREWDIGKVDVEGKVKKFREMTQEEYVEQQRAKRIGEFAPPLASSTSKSSLSFDDRGKTTGNIASTKTWADVRPNISPPPPPDIGDISESKGLYFSTVNKPVVDVKYPNFVKVANPSLPVPFLNELDVGKNDDSERKRKMESNHAEVAPPSTYDYYGPVIKQSRINKPFDSDIREAYAQGVKSLDTKVSNRQLPQHYDFTFD